MSVKLEHSARICNVLVSAQTTGQDVIECLKPDDDKVYYLVEIWKGCGMFTLCNLSLFVGH